MTAVVEETLEAYAARVLGDRLRWQPDVAPTITIGGPPRAATHIKEVRVLRAAPLHGCALPGSPGRRDDRAAEDGTPLPATKASPVQWTHLAHRAALFEIDMSRHLERTITVWKLAGLWHAAVFDGWGRTVRPLTVPGRGAASYPAVQQITNQTWHRLRADALAQPHRWVWV